MFAFSDAELKRAKFSELMWSLAIILLYGLLIPLYTWPTPLSYSDRIIGSGDAFQYPWNFWWIGRTSIWNIWQCSLLLHPFGVNLVQHDLPLLPSLIGSELHALGLTLAGSYNIGVWLTLWLNAGSAFVLILMLTKNKFASFVAGLHFAFAPFFVGRLFGHFTLLQVYPVVVFAILLTKWNKANRKVWAVLAGACLVLTAYTSYYYAVYSLILFGLFLFRRTQVNISLSKRAVNKWWLVLIVLAFAVFALALVIVVTGGAVYYLGDFRLSLLGSANPLIFSWLLFLVALIWKYRACIRLANPAPAFDKLQWFCLPLLALIPLFVAGINLYTSGNFASQRLGFKTGPAGAFVLSSLLPNVFNPIWRSYFIERLSFTNLLEYWSIGLGCTAILTVAFTRSFRINRWWNIVFAVFFLLSLGPFLRLFPGLDHGPILPFWFLRFVPIIEGARIPSRAIAIALLAWAVIFALGIQRVKSRTWRSFILVGVLLETMSIPFPTSGTTVPEIYHTIGQDKQQRAILELPFGVSDGRRSWGYYPAGRLFYQTVHEKPVVGGCASRIPDKIFDRYKEDSILQDIVGLQDGQDAILENNLRDWLRRNNIGWIILDKSTTNDLLLARIKEGLGHPDYSSSLFLAWNFRYQDKD